jgi:hypothetical protein
VRFAHLVGSLAVAALAAACRHESGGTLHAQWTSVDTALGRGSLRVSVKGTWCASRGRLTLLGLSGDTGVGILVRTVKLVPGLLAVSDTATSRSPGATIAFRLADQSTLFTLSSDSGAVAITSVDGKLAGRFVGWFSQADRGPVVLTGRFSGVTVAPDSVRCDSETLPAPAQTAAPDSGVN